MVTNKLGVSYIGAITMFRKRREKTERLEEVPTIKPGDRVLRRRRRLRGKLHDISQNVSKWLKGTASK